MDNRLLLKLWFMLLAFVAAGVVVGLTSTPTRAHGDLSWPAQFTNDKGTRCCTLNAGMGDCVRVPQELAMGLRKGSVLTLEFPFGMQTVTINAVHIGREPVICATGCLFSDVGS